MLSRRRSPPLIARLTLPANDLHAGGV